MTGLENVSRRQFLGGVFSAGAFVLAARVVPESLWAQEAAAGTRADTAAFHPSVYLGINPDGKLQLGPMQEDIQFYIDQGLMQSKPDLAKLVDNSFVEAASKELGPYKA